MSEYQNTVRVRPQGQNAIFSPVETPRGPRKVKLSAKAVEAALAVRPSGKRRERLWFEEPFGLFLLIPAQGEARYYFRFKKPSGGYSEIPLAKENQITPAIAAERARQIIAQMTLQEGFDPVVARHERIAEAKVAKLKTFRALSEAFMAAPENLDVSPKTMEVREGLLKYILPEIGDKPAKELRRSEIRETIRKCQQAIKAKRPNAQRAGHRRANQAKAFIAQIYNWAEDQEILEYNPARFKRMFREDAPKRIGKMTEEKLRAFWQGLVGEGEDPKFAEGKAVGIAIRLCMVTLQRPNEICNAKKSDFDWRESLFRISEERTKSNALYQIPLNDMAVELFREAIKLSGSSEWVFPSRSDDGEDRPVRACVTDKHWQRIRARLLSREQIPDKDVQLYDCKRWGRSKIRQLGFSREVAERCISHSQAGDPDMGSVYDVHDYLPNMRKAMDALAKELKRIISGEESSSNVIPFGNSDNAEPIMDAAE